MSDQVAATIREHAAFVWRALRHLGSPESQLEDLSQEVFIVIVQNLGRFEGRSSLSTWIYGICRNVAANARRKRARAREDLTADVPETAIAEVQSASCMQNELQENLRAALQRLPEPTRMVFVLFEIEEMEMAEVARALECPITTAYSRLYVARDHVRAALLRARAIEPNQKVGGVT